MTDDDPITLWITELRQSKPEAATKLWNQFYQRLEALARTKLDPQTGRTYDEKDAANSAFESFCRGVEAGRFNDLNDRDNLWRLLAVITARKVSQRQRHERREKRGGRLVRGSSIFAAPGSTQHQAGMNGVAGREPTPEFAAEMAENCEQLLNQLKEPTLRQIALWKFENHTNGEIARKLGCTRRTVERKLEIIRRQWSLHEGDGG